MRLLKLLLILFAFAAGPAVAGPYEDAIAAYDKGDYATALRLWRPLVEQGEARAQSNLGFMYDKGHGVPQDFVQAMAWYRKAAEQGEARAQFNLGLMYYNGQGVPQDYVQAHMWFNLSAANGNANAVKGRDIVAAKMTPAQIAEAQKLAREWKPKK
jgi:TPR repeat protein